MNTGLVVGKVFKEGRPVRGANVSLRRITTPSGLLYVESNNESTTDSKGLFAIPFGWPGDQFGEDISVISILLVALLGRRTTTSTGWNTVYAIGISSTRGYLIRDVETLIGVPLTNILQAIEQKNNADLLSFATDFRKGYEKVSVVLSRYRSAMLTTESWMIVGATNIYLT